MGGDDEQVFGEDGPRHMIDIEIDWDNEEHLRCIAACLVRGTYIMERDRSDGKEDSPRRALAPAWWESFHFRHECDYKLESPCGLECICLGKTSELKHGVTPTTRRGLIYGAVFKYAPPPDAAVAHRQSAPSYIVAFRGTMPGDPTGLADMRNNIRILLNRQHLCGRFIHARDMVERLVREERKSAGGGGVWLAGHSLGASIALDVGRHMMSNSESNLRTFLFNPPHVSLGPVIGKKVRKHVYTISNKLRSLLRKLVPKHKDHMEALFERLEPWVPNLYVNPRDIICKGFIAYFKQRELMKQRHPRLASATSLSYRDMVYSLFGRQSERPHLLPSAKLWKNQSQQRGGHGLCQWWQPQGSEKLMLSSPELYTWR